MIRSTRTGTMGRLSEQVGLNSARLRQVEQQAVTGRRYNLPSDAPSLIGEIQSVAEDAADQSVWQENAQSASNLHSAMDNALAQAHDILVRLREVAVNMASETRGASERAMGAIEVDSLRDNMLTVANTKMNDRYVFAGDAYDAEAFDPTTLAYTGSTAEPSTQVAESRYVRSGMDGSQVFQGTVDIFATISALSTALSANNTAGIQAELTNLDTATEQISEWRGEVASDQLAAEDAMAVAEGLDELFNARLSSLVSVDPVEAYTALGEAQNAYNTTLQVVAATRTTSLFDLLR
jgi:flagellar hook-associated protein 3 FlgL